MYFKIKYKIVEYVYFGTNDNLIRERVELPYTMKKREITEYIFSVSNISAKIIRIEEHNENIWIEWQDIVNYLPHPDSF